MKIRILLSVFGIIFILLPANNLYSESISTILKYGLEFGMEKKHAKKLLENAGYGKLDDISDSKHVDNITIEGSVFQTIEPDNESTTSSELEFYKDKLMSSRIMFDSDDIFQIKKLENKFLETLTAKFGNPSDKEEVMGIYSWMWQFGDYKLLLNSNSRKKRLAINCLYLPVVAKKDREEMKVKLKGRPYNVVDDQLLR